MKTFWKWIITSVTFVVIIYCLTCSYLTYNLQGTLFEREKCPACYGQSLCSNLTTSDNEIILTNDRWNILSLINVRNVHFGSINSNRVAFKKLGHDWELEKFDIDVCSTYGDISSQDVQFPCDTRRALQKILSLYGRSVFKVIKNHPLLFEYSDAVKCTAGLQHVVDFLLQKFPDHYPSHETKENFLTVLAINPEPIILKAFSEDEPSLPAFIGSCGRVVVEQFVGVPLTNFASSLWIRRANFTSQLLQLARRLSDGTLRLYLTDPSPDNFVVDDQDQVWLADAENVVIVDSQSPLLDSREHVNDGLGSDDSFSFTFEDLCGHRSADHNFFAICKSLLSTEPFESSLPGGLLAYPPAWVTRAAPALFELVEFCSYPRHSVPYTASKTRRESSDPMEDRTKGDSEGGGSPIPEDDADGRTAVMGSEAQDGAVGQEWVLLESGQLESVNTRQEAAELLERVLGQLIRKVNMTEHDDGVFQNHEL